MARGLAAGAEDRDHAAVQVACLEIGRNPRRWEERWDRKQGRLLEDGAVCPLVAEGLGVAAECVVSVLVSEKRLESRFPQYSRKFRKREF